MTLITVNSNSSPMYVITESSDIIDNKVVGASYKGKILYDSEAKVSYIILDDLTLGDYLVGTSGGASSGLTDAQLRASPVPQVLTAGTAYVGTTGGNTAQIDVIPTLTVHATYISGDYVGTSGTAMVFSGASRINNFTGTILSAVLIDAANASVPCELWLFDTAVTPPADSAAWTLSAGDMARCIGVIPFFSYYGAATNSISESLGIGMGFKTLSASTSIYGCLVTRGVPTYASGNLTVRLTILQD